MKKKRLTVFWPLVFILPFIICFLLFNLFPIIYTFYTSFFDWDGMGPKKFVGLGNYIRAITEDVNFRKSILYTIRIMVLSIPCSILLGLVLAEFLSNLTRGKHVAQTINFLPYITTPVALGLMFSFFFDWSTGLINRLLIMFGLVDEGLNWLGSPKLAYIVVAIIIIWKNTGYYMAIYLAGITSISQDVIEAARVDGATRTEVFWKIIVPLLKPITVFVTLTSIIAGLQLFDEPMLLFGKAGTVSAAGGPGRSCLSIIWNFYDVSFQTTSRLGYGSAIAILLFVIIVISVMAGTKFINRGEKTK